MMMREQGLFDEAPSLSVIQGGDRGPLADIADAMAEGKEGLVGWAKGAARSINLGDETFDDMARKLAKATRDELSFRRLLLHPEAHQGQPPLTTKPPQSSELRGGFVYPGVMPPPRRTTR